MSQLLKQLKLRIAYDASAKPNKDFVSLNS